MNHEQMKLDLAVKANKREVMVVFSGEGSREVKNFVGFHDGDTAILEAKFMEAMRALLKQLHPYDLAYCLDKDVPDYECEAISRLMALDQHHAKRYPAQEKPNA